ncbi:MAG: alpha/beta hydrolase [Deltaproteobacteria bacterium]|nr:alpha/beta hydrolase [Deltaproteobacteria bacterium]
MPTVTANNYEMYYEVDDFTPPWKPSETLWIQHGFGRSGRFWYHWVPPLAGKYRVLRRDMRGHGQSADPGVDYVWSVDDLLNDMKGFLDALRIDQVHYVGESVGGILGIAFATRWPERFKSLTLVATPPAIFPHIQQQFAVGYKDWHTALGALGAGGWAKALMTQGGGLGVASLSPQVEWLLQEWGKTRTHVLQGLCRLVPSVNITSLLPQVKVPTLLLAPARSPLSPLSEQVMIRDGIPNARIAVIEGHGHEIYLSNPEGCISALLSFLQSLQ